MRKLLANKLFAKSIEFNTLHEYYMFLIYKQIWVSDDRNKKLLTKSCSANQWTGFYMIGTSVMKELLRFLEVNN